MKVSQDELKVLPQQRLSMPFNETVAGVNAIKPVVGELTITYSASSMRLTGLIKTLLKLQCDTCLRPYFLQVSIDLDEKFVAPEYFLEEPETVQRELHSDDFVEPLPVDGVLDITDVVYQAVTLATPTYPSCGAQCPGPPANEKAGGEPAAAGKKDGRAGACNDKPIDPRWKNLKTLFPNEESQQNS
jgi:uncharacterized metal-binding protein YceD (DUF177 family)